MRWPMTKKIRERLTYVVEEWIQPGFVMAMIFWMTYAFLKAAGQ